MKRIRSTQQSTVAIKVVNLAAKRDGDFMGSRASGHDPGTKGESPTAVEIDLTASEKDA